MDGKQIAKWLFSQNPLITSKTECFLKKTKTICAYCFLLSLLYWKGTRRKLGVPETLIGLFWTNSLPEKIIHSLCVVSELCTLRCHCMHLLGQVFVWTAIWARCVVKSWVGAQPYSFTGYCFVYNHHYHSATDRDSLTSTRMSLLLMRKRCCFWCHNQAIV